MVAGDVGAPGAPAGQGRKPTPAPTHWATARGIPCEGGSRLPISSLRLPGTVPEAPLLQSRSGLESNHPLSNFEDTPLEAPRTSKVKAESHGVQPSLEPALQDTPTFTAHFSATQRPQDGRVRGCATAAPYPGSETSGQAAAVTAACGASSTPPLSVKKEGHPGEGGREGVGREVGGGGMGWRGAEASRCTIKQGLYNPRQPGERWNKTSKHSLSLAPPARRRQRRHPVRPLLERFPEASTQCTVLPGALVPWAVWGQPALPHASGSCTRNGAGCVKVGR